MPRLPILLALAAACACPPLPAQTTLETPVGGWKRAGLVDRSDELAVNYPYNLIDRGAQKGRTMIRGRLQAAGHKRPFHKLVVNGNPTPLYLDEEGRFARGYSFGSGSNSVEIRSPDGKPVKRVQFYEADRSRPQPTLRILGAWDDNQAEIDLHIVTPDGQHAYWAHPFLTNGGGLDADSVDGPGPEMFTMTTPLRGLYQVWINYWGNFGDSGYHFDESTRQRPIITSRVTLVFNENTARERREDLVIPLRSIGELTLVKSFVY
ncbi:YfaP family protein [Massilia sp. Se16.2.3]|uniref:YfaP family protein n=1 Tax=Massilia sp. Se16.2.3 TaxID=2709303 RepID=UPI001601D07E|nr:DUF2135 domain-containing protein [Massilia sp. Se16.2.3]QNB00164.1 DUF2135 domain-containing protein [Massilia sp. Se16.2.3]